MMMTFMIMIMINEDERLYKIRSLPSKYNNYKFNLQNNILP